MPLFEKSGAKTFMAVSPVCLASRRRVFSNLFKSFGEGGVNVSAFTRKRSGGKPFSRKGFPPLSFPPVLSRKLPSRFFFEAKGAKKKLSKKKRR